MARPERILSPGVRRYVEAGGCVATGRFTRLKVLLHRLMQSLPPAAPPYPTMDAATFWRLIEDARIAATGGGDMASELMRRLWTLEPETLKHFYDLFWYVMSLPGDEVHRIVYEVRGGCSDDDFLDFREWLLAQGQQTFYRVVNEPQMLRAWGEGGLGFEEGIVSMLLYQVCKARGVRV